MEKTYLPDLVKGEFKRGQLAGFERDHVVSTFGERSWRLDTSGCGSEGEPPPPRYEPIPGSPPLRLVDAVVRTVGDGKEATTYCCRASSDVPFGYAVAKVYRARKFRAFANDDPYRAGDVIPDRRAAKAIAKKTRRGRELRQHHWVDREWETLSLLHDAGADVPTPYARSSAAILMEYFGDAQEAARLLSRVRLEVAAARRLFERLVDNVELFLACDRVHGDLSGYNVLYDDGRIWVIDFPQSIDARTNPNARELLVRDLSNVARCFSRTVARFDAQKHGDELWRRYRRGRL